MVQLWLWQILLLINAKKRDVQIKIACNIDKRFSNYKIAKSVLGIAAVACNNLGIAAFAQII